MERAELSANNAIREAAHALLTHDRHLRSAWKIVADAVFHLSKFGSLRQAGTLLSGSDGSAGELGPLLKLAKELETDAKLPSISVVTFGKLGLASGSELSSFRCSSSACICTSFA